MQTLPLKIVKGVTITPPVIGRIMIGHVELRSDGERTRAIPTRDDHFTITTLVQQSDHVWEKHPIQDLLLSGKDKLTAIPVRIAYNNPALSLNNKYSAFAPNRRIICSGDGDKARRMMPEGVQTIDCPGNEMCPFGQEVGCKNMSRFYIQIEGQPNPLGVFVLRTTSRNSLDALAGMLYRLAGFSGSMLAGMPMMLTLTPMTSAQSMWSVFYVATLELRPGMTLQSALREAKAYQKTLEEEGLSQTGMEDAMLAGLANSEFADVIEDPDEWISDDEISGRAERSLQRQGLRGLDSLKAGEPGNGPHEVPGALVAVLKGLGAAGLALAPGGGDVGLVAPPDDGADVPVVLASADKAGEVGEPEEDVATAVGAVAGESGAVIEVAAEAPGEIQVAHIPAVAMFMTPPSVAPVAVAKMPARPIRTPLSMPPMGARFPVFKGRVLPGMPKSSAARISPPTQGSAP
jgi:hypothetical protein